MVEKGIEVWRGEGEEKKERIIVRGRENIMEKVKEKEEIERMRNILEDIEKKEGMVKIMEMEEEG